MAVDTSNAMWIYNMHNISNFFHPKIVSILSKCFFRLHFYCHNSSHSQTIYIGKVFESSLNEGNFFSHNFYYFLWFFIENIFTKSFNAVSFINWHFINIFFVFSFFHKNNIRDEYFYLKISFLALDVPSISINRCVFSKQI